MENVCNEIGLSMSAAFTIFAKKVGREHRIPFESRQQAKCACCRLKGGWCLINQVSEGD